MIVNAAIFDMDYTLLDRGLAVKRFAGIQFSRYADKRDAEEMVARFHARDLQGFERRQEVYNDVAEAFACILPVDDLVSEFESKAWEYAELYSGVEAMLTSLRERGIKLGIISNGSARVQNLKVDSVGLRSKIDTIAIAGELGSRKPESAVFEHVCIALDVAPEACLFVGDTPVDDVFAAKLVGMQTVWCRAHQRWPEDTPLAYDFAVDHVIEVLNLPVQWRRDGKTIR